MSGNSNNTFAECLGGGCTNRLETKVHYNTLDGRCIELCLGQEALQDHFDLLGDDFGTLCGPCPPPTAKCGRQQHRCGRRGLGRWIHYNADGSCREECIFRVALTPPNTHCGRCPCNTKDSGRMVFDGNAQRGYAGPFTGERCFVENRCQSDLRLAARDFVDHGGANSHAAARYGPDMNAWCVSDVENFSNVFYESNLGETPLITDWDVSSATSTRFMV